MANKMSVPVRTQDFQVQPVAPSPLEPLPRGGNASAEVLAGIGNSLAAKFGRIADQLAASEGETAGRAKGMQDGYRPTGSFTIRGRAEDKAATQVYASRLTSKLAFDLADLAQQHDGDPAGFMASAQALKARYDQNDVFPEIAPEFNAHFSDQVLAYRTQAFNTWRSNQREAQRASLITDLSTTETTRAQLIAGGGDDAAIERSVMRSVDESNARIDALVASGAIPADEAARLKLSSRADARVALISGRAGRMTTPEEIDTYSRQLQEEFAAGKLEGLDAESYAKLQAALASQAGRLRTGQREDVGALKRSLDDYVDRAAQGLQPTQAEWIELASKASSLGAEGQALLDTARQKATIAGVVAQLPPDQAQAWLEKFTAEQAAQPQAFVPPANRERLPAGMRNNNPGNIKYTGSSARYPGAVGPSENTDQGDPQVVFDTAESGMDAAIRLALRKYRGGKTTADQLIAGNGGWTPGNYAAAGNIAASAGVASTDDLNLNDPAALARFMRGLVKQEHGPSSDLYTDEMIRASVDRVLSGQSSGGFSRNSADLIEYAREAVDAKRKAYADDPLGAAMTEGIIGSVTTIDAAAEPAALGQQLAARAIQAKAVAAERNIDPVFLRPEERQALTNRLMAGGDDAVAVLTNVVRSAGADALPVLREIGKDAPVLAQAGALVAAGGSEAAVRDAMMAVRIKRDGADLANPPSASETSTTPDSVFGNAYTYQPETRARVQELAKLIYAGRAAREPASDDGAAWERALQEAAGATFRDNRQFGGVTEWDSSSSVQVPAGVPADSFATLMGALRDEDLTALPVPPVDENGRAYAAATIADFIPVRFGAGYRFYYPDPDTGEALFVRGADGNPFTLPWGQVERLLRQRTGIEDRP